MDGRSAAIGRRERPRASRLIPTPRERELKRHALRAHASQIAPLIDLIGAEAFDGWWVDEFFRQPTDEEWSTAPELEGVMSGRLIRSTRHHDVVVVGARCAGAATAMLLAAAGHDVAARRSQRVPSDTLSTHAIARSGVVQLNRWRLLPDVLDAGTPPIREVVFHGGGSSVTRTVKDRLGVDMLVAPRRHVLDALLVDAAVSAGAHAADRCHCGRCPSSIRRAGHRRSSVVHGNREVDISARFVVGADGRDSRIARSVDAGFTEVRRPGNGATHYAYFAGDWSAMEYHVGDADVRRGLPDERRRGVRLGVLAGRRHVTRAPNAAPRSTRHSMRWCVRPLQLLGRASRTGAIRMLRRPVGSSACPTTSGIQSGRAGRWSATPGITATRSPVTASATRSATPNCWRLLSTSSFATSATNRAALDFYHATRNEQLREIFEITCELATFPPVDRFVELQRQLGVAIDAQAEILAARPLPALVAA